MVYFGEYSETSYIEPLIKVESISNSTWSMKIKNIQYNGVMIGNEE
jgi:hypothetical protein